MLGDCMGGYYNCLVKVTLACPVVVWWRGREGDGGGRLGERQDLR